MTFDVEGPVPGNVTVRKDRPKSVAKDGQELVLQADDASGWTAFSSFGKVTL